MTTDTPARRAAREIVGMYPSVQWNTESAAHVARIIEKHMAAPPPTKITTINAGDEARRAFEAELAEDSPPPQPGTIGALLADGTITPETRVLGKLPITADGFIVGAHDEETGYELWYSWTGFDNIPVFIRKTYQSFLASTRDVSEFYSTRAAAEAARQKGKGDAP